MGLVPSLNCSADHDDEEFEPEHDEDWISFSETDAGVKALIVALNYAYIPGAQLTCTKDAKTMFRIAKRSRVQEITVLTDKDGLGCFNFPTRSVVLKHLKIVAERCEPGDWFLWFWAGHGINVPDKTGEETTGFDQAFVTPDRRGALLDSAVLIDDDFAAALDHYVPEGVRILCICDCCHSGTICDIDSYKYKHDIYQISAAQDDEEAEDTGGGGVLTTALRRAVRNLSIRHGKEEFSIQEVFDKCAKYAARMTDEQELSFQWSGPDPSRVAWPMCFPWWEYARSPNLRVNLRKYAEEEDLDDEAYESEFSGH